MTVDQDEAWTEVNRLLDEGKGDTQEYRDAFKRWQEIALGLS